ncbi:Uncharacterized protein TPAR_08694 [Tolypocladium paradoxum]|uniref:Uncharacterized protein n=1 Tax=Tolypocladium paradoxum TaxID=94208 RepID=A0A2S4KLP6_9HYPO|nr:Uncharacterized protein TPAR_08694 [Tolypocladium paradoxum]
MRARIEDYDVPPMPDASARGPDVTASWISPENLDSDHLSAFTQALANVLSTDLADVTYAQIIDGLPTRDSYSEFCTFYPAEGEHPAYNHRHLCDGVLDTTRHFRSRLDPLTLRFDPHVLQAFQAESTASPKFLLRVVELLAVSLHEIAVHLFELHQGVHRGEYDKWWASWRQRHRDAEGFYKFHAVAFPPVPFYHNFYKAFDQYPRGRANMVGYWAESKILGGVALFNRGPSDLECNELLIHGSLREGPMTIYPLTNSQWHAFASFLTSDAAAAANMPCPLPLQATSQNLPRYTLYFAMKYQHIFRDRFAFRLPARFEFPDSRDISEVDYPEREDNDWVITHTLDRYQGKQIDEEEMARRIAVLHSCQPGNPYSQAQWPDEILKGEGKETRGNKNNVWY